MEESEKRRERLQALRMEAASQGSTPPPSSTSNTSSSMSSSPHLSNPLAQPGSPTPSSSEATPPPSRFDFYTDPMSAYSGSKQRSSGGRGGYNLQDSFASSIRSPSPTPRSSSNHRPDYQAGPRTYHMVTPPHQFQMTQTPDQSPYRTPQHAPQNSQWRTPVPFGSPFAGAGSMPPSNPGVWNRSGGSSGHGFPPSSSWGSGSSHPSRGFGRGGSPMNNSGRGNYWPSGGNPSPGRGGGGGRGRGHHHGSAHQGREQSSIKAMVKDPWRKLKPVVGSILHPLAGQDSWLPMSLTAKKVKLEETGNKINSQSSFADCLALAFEEAVNDASV